MIQIKNYINGCMAEPESNNYFDNPSPVDGKVFSQIPDSDATDIDNAVSAAKDAFQSWSKLTKNGDSRNWVNCYFLHRSS